MTDAIQNIVPDESGAPVVLKLSGDTPSYGISVASGADFTLDLNGHAIQLEKNADGEYAGSSGTKTCGFQLLKDSNIVFEGGEIAADDSKILVQNYSNLTLKDVTLRGTSTDTYVLSNNFGEVHLTGNTKILAEGNNVAFDVWYGMNKVYDDGVSVYIDDPAVVIQGKVEFGRAKRASEANFLERAHLYVCDGFDRESLNIVSSSPAPGYTFSWELADNGMWSLIATPVAE